MILVLLAPFHSVHADPEREGEVIVVTGSRMAEPAKDEAASVDSMSRAELDRSPARPAMYEVLALGCVHARHAACKRELERRHRDADAR